MPGAVVSRMFPARPGHFGPWAGLESAADSVALRLHLLSQGQHVGALLVGDSALVVGEDRGHVSQRQAAWQEREALAEELHVSLQEGGIDPLLSTLARLHDQRLQLEADMRLLMAYGRCFTSPRPYKLIDLARASGLSISGVRIAFTDDEITQASEILRRPPVSDDRPAPAPE
jgi:hypothetical protein